MLKWAVPIIVLAVAGCDSVVIEACEDFIKDGLASPSSYHRVSVIELTEPITVEELQELRSEEMLDEIWEDKPRSLHLVSIEFDADNAYGASLRGARVCAFERIDEFPPDDDIVRSNARSAASVARLRELIEAGAVPNVDPSEAPPRSRYDCCL